MTKQNTIIIGDGSYKLPNKDKKKEAKSKIIKIRITSEQDSIDFLNKMSTRFNKDYTKTKLLYEDGCSDNIEERIPVNWEGMPSFDHDTDKWSILHVLVETKEEFDWFLDNTNNHNNASGTFSVWYPCKPQNQDQKWTTNTKIQTRYPIYIISKGRYDTNKNIMTWTHLDKMQLNYKVVVEDNEYDLYLQHSQIPKDKLLRLPTELCNLGCGGVPARNFCWENSIKNGYSHHWIMDDNLNGFYRFHLNRRLLCESGVYFNHIEKFMQKYDNLYMCGLSYTSDIPEIDKTKKAIVMNSKLYSCILIKNDLDQILDEKWRGVYNEDVDLVLRVLKKGCCTIGFQTFTCHKSATLSMKGGNTDSIYKDKNVKFEGMQKKVDSLLEQHPGLVKQTNNMHIDGRPHHKVDYSSFKKNKLTLKPKDMWWSESYPELYITDK